MWRTLFDRLSEYGDPLPRYTGPRCLVERGAMGGCTRCADVCPHAAVTVTHTVVIEESRCTSCGLCVQECPTGALEFDLPVAIAALNEQRQDGEETLQLRCARASAAAPSLPCLGRVTPALLSAAGAYGLPLTLWRGDCADCAVGGPEVPARVEAVVRETARLRGATTPAQVELREALGSGGAGSGDAGAGGAGGGRAVGRRGMLGGALRQAAGLLGEAIPERPLPFVDWSVPKERVPAEWVWRRHSLTPPPQEQTFWPAPVIDDACTDCPVCANVCPTEAIGREVLGSDSTLTLNLAACTGCEACIRSCPPAAMHRREYWPVSSFEAPVLLRMAGQSTAAPPRPGASGAGPADLEILGTALPNQGPPGAPEGGETGGP